ncbi:MAG: tripartite tricarboxylate transporter TctB family protein [Halanaerobiales bacterium]|nr:tripartite tricarboxylate transporter TctB family protein [Halanaerobiales bacterium]
MGLNIFDKISFLLVFITEALLVGDIAYKVGFDDFQIFTKDSPLLFPFLLSIILGICVVFLFIRLYNKMMESKDKQKINKQEDTSIIFGSSDNKISKSLIIFLLIFIIYSIFLPMFHFLIATIIFVFITMTILNESQESIKKKALKSLAISIVAVPLIYYIFYNVFEVVFP